MLENACLEGFKGEVAHRREPLSQILPFADFFEYFLVQDKKVPPPAGIWIRPMANACTVRYESPLSRVLLGIVLFSSNESSRTREGNDDNSTKHA